jgi:hypothetical protein
VAVQVMTTTTTSDTYHTSRQALLNLEVCVHLCFLLVVGYTFFACCECEHSDPFVLIANVSDSVYNRHWLT